MIMRPSSADFLGKLEGAINYAVKQINARDKTDSKPKLSRTRRKRSAGYRQPKMHYRIADSIFSRPITDHLSSRLHLKTAIIPFIRPLSNGLPALKTRNHHRPLALFQPRFVSPRSNAHTHLNPSVLLSEIDEDKKRNQLVPVRRPSYLVT